MQRLGHISEYNNGLVFATSRDTMKQLLFVSHPLSEHEAASAPSYDDPTVQLYLRI